MTVSPPAPIHADADAETHVTCFGPCTRILTSRGQRSIEELVEGDLIWTQHHGMQPIRWIGRSTVQAKGALAPIVIAPDALHNDRELVVSQEHRMCLRLPAAELLFGTHEVLVPAKHLIALPGIRIREGGTITYTNFMFDRHEIIYANGQLTESFFLSDFMVNALSDDQMEDLRSLFPYTEQGTEQGTERFGPAAAMVLKGDEALVLSDRITPSAA